MARTLLDVAATEKVQILERAIANAEFERILDMDEVRWQLDHRPWRQGRRRLIDATEIFDPTAGLTREELEGRFLELCRRCRLPVPEFNAPVMIPSFDEIAVDCLWRPQRLIAELDSRRAHDTASAFESDRARDAQLMIAGWRVVRLTWRQVVGKPDATAETIRKLLAGPDPVP